MKKVMPPPDASINVQKAITDLQANTDELSGDVSDVIHREEFEKMVDELRTELGLATRKKALDINDVFRGGDSHAHGYVPDPGNQGAGGPTYLTSDGEFAPLLDGAIVSGDPGVGGSSLANKVVEVHGSLAVTGALQADNVLTRNEQVYGNISFGGSITGAINASQVTTVPVTGAQTFLSATDLQSDLNKLDTDSLIQVMPAGAGGTSLDQRYMNVMGSVGVVGSLSAHTLRSRLIMVSNKLDAPFIGVRVNKSTNTSLTASGAMLDFDVVDYDTNGFFAIAAPTRLTVPAGFGGYYRVTGRIQSTMDATSAWRQLDILKNAAGSFAAGAVVGRVIIQDPDETTAAYYEVTTTVYLADTDYVEFWLDTSQNCTITNVNLFYDIPCLEMFRIGT